MFVTLSRISEAQSHQPSAFRQRCGSFMRLMYAMRVKRSTLNGATISFLRFALWGAFLSL
jgi:hypothetical protein